VKYDNVSIIPVDLSPKANFDDFFEDYHFITLATGDQYLIKDIDKIHIDDDKIYVLDKRNFSVLIFDTTGNYLNHLKRQGNGPGEYVDITDFMVVDSSIFVLSRAMKKILVYSISLNYVESYSLDDFYDYCYYLDKKIFLYSSYSNDTHFNIRVYDIESRKIEKNFLPFKVNQSFSFSPTPFNKTFDGNLFVTQQYDYNVYEYKHNVLDTIFKFDFNTKDKIPDNFQDIEFAVIYRDLSLKSVVKRIDYINQINDCVYLTFFYNHVPHISKVSLLKNTNTTLKLEVNDKFPFVFATITGFYKNYLTGYLHAPNVLIFNDKFPSDKSQTGFLNEDDNPVLFFHKLKIP
jgi:hypothetical protein